MMAPDTNAMAAMQQQQHDMNAMRQQHDIMQQEMSTLKEEGDQAKNTVQQMLQQRATEEATAAKSKPVTAEPPAFAWEGASGSTGWGGKKTGATATEAWDTTPAAEDAGWDKGAKRQRGTHVGKPCFSCYEPECYQNKGHCTNKQCPLNGGI